MTLIQYDLYTTFCFTWGWPWKNAAHRIYMSAIISAFQFMFFPPFIFPLVLFSCFCMHPLSLRFFSPSLSVSRSYTAEGSKCKSSRTIFFSRALISADDVSKEVKGTTQRPTQLLSPIHRLQIYVSLSLFFLSFSPTPALFPTTFSTLSISIGLCT